MIWPVWQLSMELHGTTEANLVAAVRSARRLRGHPVHADTVKHWTDLLHQARQQLAAGDADAPDALRQLIADLETELVDHSK